MNVNEEALLNCCVALEEAPPEVKKIFTMTDYSNRCGTPQCVLGHYAHRTDLQDVFTLCNGYVEVRKDHDPKRVGVYYVTLDHFKITAEHRDLLFSGNGCADAKTPEQAIRYIKWFIERCKVGESVSNDRYLQDQLQAN